MTRTASPASRSRQDMRRIDATIGRIDAALHNPQTSDRIAARLARYAGGPPPDFACSSQAPAAASAPDGRDEARAAAAPSGIDTDSLLRQVGEETARRIEASIAATLGEAFSTLRGDLAARAADGERLAMLGARLEALEAAGPEIARSIARAMDERLDAVDGHLADLTRTLARHPAWDLENGLQQLHARLATLADAAGENALRQVSADAMRRIVDDALRSIPQPTLPDLETSVTQPVLAAIDAAVARFAATQKREEEREEPRPAAAMPAVSDFSLAHAIRDDVAAAQAGHTQDIRTMATRLDALQDSVSALTGQLRAAREASERADMLAHANAMAVAGPRGDITAAMDDASPAPVGRQTASLPESPAPARQAPPAGAPTPSEMKSRLIAAARRANATGRDTRRDGRPAERAPMPAIRRDRPMARWLRGKGLLWAAAVIIGAGSVPLLAPALRALPDAILPAPGDNAGQPAERAPEKIGSHLTTSAHPASIVDDPAALYALGDRIAEGSATGSPRLAASLLEKAAERGQAPAQYRIARLYEKGAGVARDPRRARDWYARAAGQGNVRAMHNLAVMYADGSLGPADYGAAATWFRKAAERGLGDSQYNLGVLLARGLAGKADPAEAWVWFDIGARGGDQEAAARRNEIAASLAPEALQAARDASAAWRPAPVDVQANDPPATGGAGTTAGAQPAKGARPTQEPV